MRNPELMNCYSIEDYGGGYIICDYSGKRGRFGAAYLGTSGEWLSQPIGLAPFGSKGDAQAVSEIHAARDAEQGG